MTLEEAKRAKRRAYLNALNELSEKSVGKRSVFILGHEWSPKNRKKVGDYHNSPSSNAPYLFVYYFW